MEIRDRIIETAGNLFFSDGIRRVTMDQIARKMGMSKRTIYELFKDKNELLKASLETFTAKYDKDAEDLKRNSSNTMEVIVAALEFGIKAIKEINPAYFEDLEMYYPELWQEKMYQKRQERFLEFQELVKHGIEEAYFRENLNVKMVAKIFIEQMNLMHNREIFPPDAYPAAELFETLFLNFIRGISTFKGIEKLEELLKMKLNQ